MSHKLCSFMVRAGQGQGQCRAGQYKQGRVGLSRTQVELAHLSKASMSFKGQGEPPANMSFR